MNKFKTKAQKNLKGSGGNFPKWHGIPAFWPPKKDSDSAKVRFIKNEITIEVPYGDGIDTDLFSYKEHWINRPSKDGKRKGFNMICSTDTDKQGRCLSCHYASAGKKHISPFRIMTPLQLIDYTVGHLKPNDDSSKKPRFEPCTMSRPCKGSCEKDMDMTIAGARMLTLGPSHLSHLGEFQEHIGKTCRSCGGDIHVVSFDCPACEGEIVSADDLTEWSPKEINEFSGREGSCSHCDYEGTPEEVIDCESCDNPERTEIYNVDVHIKKAGEGTQSALQLQKSGQTGRLGKEFKQHIELFEFQSILVAPTLDEQAAILGEPNIFEGSKSSNY